MSRCPFCKCDPFHYVNNGIGYEAVAVNCCDLGCDLWSKSKARRQAANRVLRNMRSYSPRKKAMAQMALIDAGLRKSP